MLIFEFRKRFTIRRVGDHEGARWAFRDGLSPRSARVIEAPGFSLENIDVRRAALRMFVPMCIGHSPLAVKERPESVIDSHFWQFPAITERLALERHAELKGPEWRQGDAAPIQTYLGLPWASYIDTKNVPDSVRQVFGVRMRGYRALADEWGLQWGREVVVHTVCQHIYWERLLPLWAELGITDLHLSHCEPGSMAIAEKFGLRVHSWPLAAANVVNPERREGLALGKKLEDRGVLASFIGAHMPHYRSDVRLRLRDEAARETRRDVVFELNDDWHFNPAVYEAQIKGVSLSVEQETAERNAMVRYNALLSDSVFALCPEGAGPNTLRLWESLATGTIPVVIVEDWVWPPVPGEGLCWEDCVITLRRNEVVGLFDRLRRLRREQAGRLVAMQAAGSALYERFERMLCF